MDISPDCSASEIAGLSFSVMQFVDLFFEFRDGEVMVLARDGRPYAFGNELAHHVLLFCTFFVSIAFFTIGKACEGGDRSSGRLSFGVKVHIATRLLSLAFVIFETTERRLLYSLFAGLLLFDLAVLRIDEDKEGCTPTTRPRTCCFSRASSSVL